MPMGKGTYGSKRGRPAKKKAAKKGMGGMTVNPKKAVKASVKSAPKRSMKKRRGM